MELKPRKTGNYKHGYSVTHPKLFGVWESMRSRCNNPNRDKYKDYGARGIHVCVNGVTKSVAEWCETIDISPFTVYWWVKSKGEKYAETRLSELA